MKISRTIIDGLLPVTDWCRFRCFANESFKPRSLMAHVLLGGCLWLLMGNLPESMLAAQPAKKPMRETAVLPTDGNATRRLVTAQDLLAEKRWLEAINTLQEIAQSDNHSLIQIHRGNAGETSAYVSVMLRCNEILAKLPPEGRDVYRKKVDPQAKRWHDIWLRSHDEAELQRIVRQAYLSSYGDDALLALGEAAWDRGDFANARHWWQQLIAGTTGAGNEQPAIPRFPDSPVSVAEVRARLILCSLGEGELDRAATELKQFANLHPAATGRIAGKEGTLTELLQQMLVDSAKWPPVNRGRQADPTRGGTVARSAGERLPGGMFASQEDGTFGLSVERMRTLHVDVDLGAELWQRPLAPNLLPQVVNPDRKNVRPALTHPILFRNLVLTNDATGIDAVDLLTGTPVWPNAQGTARIYTAFPDEPIGPPEKSCVGVPEFTMTVADGRLYARMGTPVTTPASAELRPLNSEIVCLDLLEGQGKLVWRVTGSELPHDGNHLWWIEGSPLVKEGRAYCVLNRKRPQLEFAVACWDAADGRLLWLRPVCTGRSPVEDNQNRVSHLLLTAGAGKLFLSPDSGAIIALDPQDGHPEWAVTYESESPEGAGHLSDPDRQGASPPVFHDGLLFVIPNDSNKLYCIDVETGRVIWDRQPSSGSLFTFGRVVPQRWRHILGVASGGELGRVIVSGRRLMAIDIATKRTVWTVGSGNDNELGCGRGAVTNNSVYWPTMGGLIVVNSLTGDIQRRVDDATRESRTCGNISLTDGILLVASDDRITAYGEFARIRKRLKDEFSLRPTDRSLLVRIAELKRIAGEEESALKLLRIAAAPVIDRGKVNELLKEAKPAESDSPEKPTLRPEENTPAESSELTGKQADEANRRLAAAQLNRLLREDAQHRIDDGEVEAALGLLTESLAHAGEPTELAETLLELAEIEAEHQRLEAAVGHWQQILDNPSLRSLPGSEPTARDRAVSGIANAIQSQGLSVYAAVEQQATAAFQLASQKDDLKELSELVERFPHSQAAHQNRLSVADRLLNKGLLAAACQQWESIALGTGAKSQRTDAFVAWADALEKVRAWRTARRVWKQLEQSFPANEPLAEGEPSRTIAMLVAERLQRAEHVRSVPAPSSDRLQADKAESAVPLLKRIWIASNSASTKQHDSPAKSRKANPLQNPKPDLTTGHTRPFVVPQGEAPSPEMAVVIQYSQRGVVAAEDTGDVIALQRTTGRELWRVASKAPRWVSYADAWLLMATDFSIALRSLETGGIVWEVPRFRGGKPKGSKVSGTPSVNLAVRGSHLFEFEPETGVRAINLFDGREEWSFVPAEGKLQPVWSCGTSRLAVQTLRPAATWVLEATGRKNASQLVGLAEPWRVLPVFDVADQVIGLNRERQVASLSLSDGALLSNEDRAEREADQRARREWKATLERMRQATPHLKILIEGQDNVDGLLLSDADAEELSAHYNRWQYANGISFAFAEPVIWMADGALLLTIDGTTLCRLDSDTGQRLWGTGLGNVPLTDPAQQVVVGGGHAFACSGGILRAISLNSGDVKWEAFLGDSRSTWKVATDGKLVAAWASSSPNDLSAASTVTWCDANTGRFVHKLTRPQGHWIQEVTAAESVFVVVDDASATAFRHDQE